MALNVKILYPLDHPPVTYPTDEPIELSASAGELDTSKEDLDKNHLLEQEEDSIYRNGFSESSRLNILT